MNHIRVCCLIFLATAHAACAAEPSVTKQGLPARWKATDLGLANVPGATQPAASAPATTRPAARASVPGSATFADGVFQLQGTMDLWGTADGCHFVYRPADGDVELIARIAAVDNPGGVAHAKASLLIRASLEAGSPSVTYAVTATDGTQLLHRDAADGKTGKVTVDAETQKKLIAKATFPIWLKLVRAGDEFSAYESTDGGNWQKSGTLTLKLPKGTLVGIAVSSHKPDVTTKATFDHVTLRESAPKKAGANSAPAAINFDQSTPKEALRSLLLAMAKGDSLALRSVGIATEEQFKDLDSVLVSEAAMNRLSDAAREKYGKDNSLTIRVNPPGRGMNLDIKALEVKEDGDRATITSEVLGGKVLQLTKVDGKWKIDLTPLCAGLPPREQAEPIWAASIRPADETIAEINAGKHATAEDAWNAFMQKHGVALAKLTVTLSGSLVCNGACVADPKADDHPLVLFAVDGTPEVRSTLEQIIKDCFPEKGQDAAAAEKMMDQFSAKLKYYIEPTSPALQENRGKGGNHYCKPAEAKAVTGVVSERDGKRWITATKIAPAQLKYPAALFATDKPFAMPEKEPLVLKIDERLSLRCIAIPAGEFFMGTPVWMWPYFVEEYPHRVTLTTPFYLAEIPVTQEIFEAVMGSNPSTLKDPHLPVQNPTFADIEKFCQKLSEKTGKKVRLPTDAEWEYAARVGTSNPGFAEKYKEQNSSGNAGFKEVLKVKSKQPNAWGLYDMASCWWEITADKPIYNVRRPEQDPKYPPADPTSGKIQRSGRGIVNAQWTIGTHEFIGEKGYAGQKFRIAVEMD